MPRLLLLLPTTTYRAADFLEAARKLAADVTVGSEKSSTLEDLNPAGLLTLDLRDPPACAAKALEFAREHPIDAVAGVDDDSVEAAAAIAEALEIAHNPASAVRASRHKATMRRTLAKAGVPVPPFRLFTLEEDPERAAREIAYPCVLKPTFLAASRGVIRADSHGEFVAAWKRIAALLADPEVASKGGEAARELLAERFVPGEEFALEGLLRQGELSVLALFDKPDPLHGPFFEETIYVTPSRLPGQSQGTIARTVERACRALGLLDGPIHAEVRWNEQGPWILEVAARSIGGLCSRTLRFGTGMTLEEIILRHALRLPLPSLVRERRASGVMMIPIPQAGVLERVRGLDEACAVPNVEQVTISAHVGQRLVPLPEASRYLGFIFSRAETPEEAEKALREAHARLTFVISAEA